MYRRNSLFTITKPCMFSSMHTILIFELQSIQIVRLPGTSSPITVIHIFIITNNETRKTIESSILVRILTTNFFWKTYWKDFAQDISSAFKIKEECRWFHFKLNWQELLFVLAATKKPVQLEFSYLKCFFFRVLTQLWFSLIEWLTYRLKDGKEKKIRIKRRKRTRMRRWRGRRRRGLIILRAEEGKEVKKWKKLKKEEVGNNDICSHHELIQLFYCPLNYTDNGPYA